jgi:hypothetical protein
VKNGVDLSDLPDNEIVVIMDGYDVLFINDIGLEDKFKSFNTNILFGSDNVKSKLHKFLYEKTFPSKCKHNGNKISLNSSIYWLFKIIYITKMTVLIPILMIKEYWLTYVTMIFLKITSSLMLTVKLF